MGITRTLQDGDYGLLRQLDILELEDHVGNVDKFKHDPRRAVHLARLAKLRATMPQKAAGPVSADHPAAVLAGLELLRSKVPVRRVDTRALKAQLRDGRGVLREALFAQHAVDLEIRDRLSMELAKKKAAEHRALVVTQFRAAQQLAAATDAIRNFHRAISEAGYMSRPDLLPAPSSRGALILGSESDFDSEITKMRQTLEELKAI
jgi:hypothetical protein